MRKLLLVLAGLILTGCGSVAYSPTTIVPTTSPGLKAVHDPGEVTGHLSGRCYFRAQGQLPDPRCTPGSLDPAITREKLCASGYTTRPYRPSPSRIAHFKYDEAYPAYDVPRSVRSELDHLIPLELGGSNDATNLWPEVGSIPNGKDRVENRLHFLVCAGKLALRTAQEEIAHNWMMVAAGE